MKYSIKLRKIFVNENFLEVNMINADITFFDREKDKVKKLFDEYPNLIKKIVVLGNDWTSWYVKRTKRIYLNNNISKWTLYHEFGHVLQHINRKTVKEMDLNNSLEMLKDIIGEEKTEKIKNALKRIENKYKNEEIKRLKKELKRALDDLIADNEAINYFGEESKQLWKQALYNSLSIISESEFEFEGISTEFILDSLEAIQFDEVYKIKYILDNNLITANEEYSKVVREFIYESID